MKFALLCGGPSPERGISLNSARSALDHLESETTEVLPFYIDLHKSPYKISKSQLYSNTPSDFDFKLHQTATPLTEEQFIRALKQSDLVLPIMHGAYGEDGTIQRLLEKNGIPFLGSGSQACKQAFDKYNANAVLKENGFFTLPSTLLKGHTGDHEAIIRKFFAENQVRRAVVKPATGGSSIGVFSVNSPDEALQKAQYLFSKRTDTRIVVETFAEGHEFTIIVLENRFGLPVALPPTEIETDYTENQIFDFRKKYLPTRQVTWHCPPRFSDTTIERIQVQAEQIFRLFGLRDFARFDGWVLPSGEIWFCDLNPISGMEQNIFLFQQGARVGLTHSDMLNYVVQHACQRYNIPFFAPLPQHNDKRLPIAVLAGGTTSERQVSLMSGTNVWLKLRKTKRYKPQLHILAPQETVWKVPYHLALNHTVEEILDNCTQYNYAHKRMHEFEARSRLRLGLTTPSDADTFGAPEVMSLQEFIQKNPFVFIALHGGMGEDGTLQHRLSEANVSYNGSRGDTSRLCMDKWETAERIRALQIDGLTSIPNCIIRYEDLLACGTDPHTVWDKARKTTDSDIIIIKPRGDGCSTGVVRLESAQDLQRYAQCVKEGLSHIPANTFRNQNNPVDMPQGTPHGYLLERFIETDKLYVKGNQLKYFKVSGWVEVTVGVLEKEGQMHALNPSITIAEGQVLSVEEKFQGGTGINITPPPSTIIPTKALQLIKQRIQAMAQSIGLRGYARIDTFVNVRTGAVLVIEINTLPALTPSTVLYHQGLSEPQPLFPQALLDTIIIAASTPTQKLQTEAPTAPAKGLLDVATTA